MKREKELRVEIVLIIAAAGGLLGCLAPAIRVDASRLRHQPGRPIARCAVR